MKTLKLSDNAVLTLSMLAFIVGSIAVSALDIALNMDEPVSVKSELFVLTISECVGGFCNDFALDTDISWEDCMHAADAHLIEQPDAVWACVPMILE